MKKIICLLFIVILLLTACGNYLESNYTAVLPSVPEQWVSLLGQPHWHVEWLAPNGDIQKKDFPPAENDGQLNIQIDIPVTWANPVTAWPYWSEHNLNPGLFKPAGALFPYDTQGGKLLLSWEAGHDTVFYRELVFANGYETKKVPANFDWLRFRELFKTGRINEEARKDPWLVDWESVAERTISSNFDSRRLVPSKFELLAIPAGAGPWYGSSPFADPIFDQGGLLPVFPVRQGINVWVSGEGILKVSGSTWVLTEIKE